jgi:hypothetical protein
VSPLADPTAGCRGRVDISSWPYDGVRLFVDCASFAPDFKLTAANV